MIYHLDPSHDGKGGAVRYINSLIRNLLTEGVNVTLIGSQIVDQTFTHEKFSYVPIVKNNNAWWRYLIALFLKLPFLKLPPDTIIHVHRIEYIIPFMFFNRNNPLIYTIHGERLGTARSNYSTFKYQLVDKIFFLYEKLVFNRVNKIIVVSEKAKESFTKLHAHITPKIVTIPVGVELDKFDRTINRNKYREKYFLKNEDFVILFVGVLGKIKNVDFLIDSFQNLLPRVDAKLVIVGDGDEKSNLLNKVQKLNLSNKIIFTGEIEHAKIYELYLSSNLFVLSSYSEGSPTVVKEALASGIPVISTNVGDVKEVINNKYLGKVIEQYDAKVFAKAMLETIELIETDEDLVRSKCRLAANKYNVKSITKEIIQVYTSYCVE